MVARWGCAFVQLFCIGVPSETSKGILAGIVGSLQPWLWLPAGFLSYRNCFADWCCPTTSVLCVVPQEGPSWKDSSYFQGNS